MRIIYLLNIMQMLSAMLQRLSRCINVNSPRKTESETIVKLIIFAFRKF